MKKKAIICGICMILLCSCSFSEQQEEQKQETTTLDVTAEENDESIILEENGKLMVKKGRINELFCFLPGYKKIPVDMEKIETELEQVFSYLEKAEKRAGDDPLARLDGAGVKIRYTYEGQEFLLEMYSTYENNSIMVNINGGGIGYSEMLISGEVFQFIHERSGWKEFDVTQLSTITSMTAQVTQGYEASNQVVEFSENETQRIMDQFIRSAEVSGEGSCGYNIHINLYRDGALLYQGYLAGDSCAEIALESRYFHIDSDIVKAIYKKLEYDMPVGK